MQDYDSLHIVLQQCIVWGDLFTFRIRANKYSSSHWHSIHTNTRDQLCTLFVKFLVIWKPHKKINLRGFPDILSFQPFKFLLTLKWLNIVIFYQTMKQELITVISINLSVILAGKYQQTLSYYTYRVSQFNWRKFFVPCNAGHKQEE